MEIADNLQCLFSARIETDGDSYTIEIPKREIHLGTIGGGETYRVALLPTPETSGDEQQTTATPDRDVSTRDPSPKPPVSEGEERIVEIEDIGDQGDGITRVERGFVVIVPDTDQGERVTIEVTDVQQNVAFAEVVERLSYYD